jgi:cytidylate kinase
LRQATDAVVIETDHLTQDEALQQALEAVRNGIAARAARP